MERERVISFDVFLIGLLLATVADVIALVVALESQLAMGLARPRSCRKQIKLMVRKSKSFKRGSEMDHFSSPATISQYRFARALRPLAACCTQQRASSAAMRNLKRASANLFACYLFALSPFPFLSGCARHSSPAASHSVATIGPLAIADSGINDLIGWRRRWSLAGLQRARPMLAAPAAHQ